MRAAGYPIRRRRDRAQPSRSGSLESCWPHNLLSESRLDEHRVLATGPEARPLLSEHYRLRPGIKGRRILHRYSKRKDQSVFRSFAISVNGANGVSDIEGKAAREAVSECGQRASFNLS